MAIAPWTTTTTTTTNSTTTALHNPYNSSIPLEHSRKHTLGVAVLTDESATHINLLQEPPTSKRQRREATAGTTTTNTNARRRLAIHIMFDGGARGNPGVGGSGASITVRDTTENLHVSASSSANESLRRTIHVRYYVGANVTNNQAEYQGLLYGLAAAKREVQRESGRLTTETAMTTDLLVQGDSNLIIEQLKGSYRVNSKKLIPLYRKAKELLESISNLGPHNLSLEHVYRDHNKVADGMYMWPSPVSWSLVLCAHTAAAAASGVSRVSHTLHACSLVCFCRSGQPSNGQPAELVYRVG